VKYPFQIICHALCKWQTDEDKDFKQYDVKIRKAALCMAAPLDKSDKSGYNKNHKGIKFPTVKGGTTQCEQKKRCLAG
jgi:hypothetical protein